MTRREFETALERNGFRLAYLFWYEDTTGQTPGVLYSGVYDGTTLHDRRRDTVRRLIAQRARELSRRAMAS